MPNFYKCDVWHFIYVLDIIWNLQKLLNCKCKRQFSMLYIFIINQITQVNYFTIISITLHVSFFRSLMKNINWEITWSLLLSNLISVVVIQFRKKTYSEWVTFPWNKAQFILATHKFITKLHIFALLYVYLSFWLF